MDEAAKGVVRDELLVVQLKASRGRGVVGLEPLLDGAALVRMAVRLICDGQGIIELKGHKRGEWCQLSKREGAAELYL